MMQTGIIEGEGIRRLRLSDFRSYDGIFDMKIADPFAPVVLIGKNGAGKTNLLEALSFLVPGRGLRRARLADVVCCHAPSQEWSVFAETCHGGFVTEIGTGVTSSSSRRQIKINGQAVSSQGDFGDTLSMLWITPAMDRLFSSEPASRRHFLDRLVQAFDGGHAKRCSDYHKALRQWGQLLKSGNRDDRWLSSLEEVMVSSGVAVSAARLDIVERISKYLKVSDGAFPTAVLNLKGFVEESLKERPALLVEEMFRRKIKENRAVYADGGNFSGPHTADMEVFYAENNQNASLCSTGEQKALLISIVLAQLQAEMKEKGRCPILLLDEIEAHLDPYRQQALLDILKQLPGQVWFTGTDASLFTNLQAQVFNIENSTASLLQAVA